MSYIVFIYGLSITYLFISLMKYKHNERLGGSPIKIDKTSIVLALFIKPIIFTGIAIALNMLLGQQTGFWLIGGGHLLIGFYYLSSLYISSKKHTSLLSEQI
jgi:hypothetical protein